MLPTVLIHSHWEPHWQLGQLLMQPSITFTANLTSAWSWASAMVSTVHITLQLPITCLGECECEIYREIYRAIGEWSFDLGCGFFTKYCFNATPMSPHSLSALLDFILFWRPGAAGFSLFWIQCNWKSWRQWDDTFKRSHWIMHALFPVNPTCGGRPFWIEGGNAGLKCCPEWPLSQGVPRLSANGSWMDGFNLMIIRDYKPFGVKNWHDNGHSKKVLSLFFYFNLFRWRFQFLEITPNEKRIICCRELSLVILKVYVLDQWVSASGNMAHRWGEKHWCIVLCQSQWSLIFFERRTKGSEQQLICSVDPYYLLSPGRRNTFGSFQ